MAGNISSPAGDGGLPVGSISVGGHVWRGGERSVRVMCDWHRTPELVMDALSGQRLLCLDKLSEETLRRVVWALPSAEMHFLECSHRPYARFVAALREPEMWAQRAAVDPSPAVRAAAVSQAPLGQVEWARADPDPRVRQLLAMRTPPDQAAWARTDPNVSVRAVVGWQHEDPSDIGDPDKFYEQFA